MTERYCIKCRKITKHTEGKELMHQGKKAVKASCSKCKTENIFYEDL